MTRPRFRLFQFRSPLLSESLLMSSPPGTEMVQFPGYRCRALSIHARLTDSSSAGLPHSAISGSRDICSSPELFAAYRGLLRRRAPRHPPWTLSRLTILSFYPFQLKRLIRFSLAFFTLSLLISHFFDDSSILFQSSFFFSLLCCILLYFFFLLLARPKNILLRSPKASYP